MAQSKDSKDDAFMTEKGLESSHEIAHDELINASGHIQEVDRNFGLVSLTGYGLLNGNVWPALGGTILVGIFNGGPPGVIYELLGGCF